MNLVIQQSREWAYLKLVDKDMGKEVVRFGSQLPTTKVEGL